ncbi:hypothetical protein, partial [Bradyrhizobium sp. Mp27]|uniref:hypothetical protein n=1 Tax=Bradyrhizobium sp. Mp27 TaxID=3042157 RepID=UPI00248C2ADF
EAWLLKYRSIVELESPCVGGPRLARPLFDRSSWRTASVLVVAMRTAEQLVKPKRVLRPGTRDRTELWLILGDAA